MRCRADNGSERSRGVVGEPEIRREGRFVVGEGVQRRSDKMLKWQRGCHAIRSTVM